MRRPARSGCSACCGHIRKNAWLNPSREDYWRHTHSIDLLRQIMEDRMYPMTLSGLDDLTRELSH